MSLPPRSDRRPERYAVQVGAGSEDEAARVGRCRLIDNRVAASAVSAATPCSGSLRFLKAMRGKPTSARSKKAQRDLVPSPPNEESFRIIATLRAAGGHYDQHLYSCHVALP